MTRVMRSALPAVGLALLGLALPAFAAGPPAAKAAKKARPKVEVVFCLDTTGSMTGLIQGAKDKIWAICNQIAGGQPVPDLKVGLVAYRDRTDAYVTQVTDLTDDLDEVHARLKKFEARGGGDLPESVNQALHDAVHKVKWSADKKALRIVFLVGDAPPHMDYADDVKYPATCKKAVEKGIIINAVQCGTNADCTRTWKDIAARASGAYVAIPQSGGVVRVATRFDAPLARVGARLFDTAMIYGSAGDRKRGERRREAARRLKGAVAADRAAYAARSGRLGPYDLLDAIAAKRVKLSEVREAELPDALRRLAPRERQAHLDTVAARRKELFAEALALEKKRAAAIAAERGSRGKDSFDEQVLVLLRKQAAAFEIRY